MVALLYLRDKWPQSVLKYFKVCLSFIKHLVKQELSVPHSRVVVDQVVVINVDNLCVLWPIRPDDGVGLARIGGHVLLFFPQKRPYTDTHSKAFSVVWFVRLWSHASFDILTELSIACGGLDQIYRSFLGIVWCLYLWCIRAEVVD